MKKKVNYTKEIKVKACELVLKDEVKVKTVAEKINSSYIISETSLFCKSFFQFC